MKANSRFKKSVNEWGRVEEWIEPGDDISQDDINVSDEEWQELIDRGVVVEDYPEDLDPGVPPVDYYRENPREATVDETTPSHEAMGKLDTAAARGEKLPGQTEGEEANKANEEETKPGWMKKD